MSLPTDIMDCVERLKGYLRANTASGDSTEARWNRKVVYDIIQSQQGREGAIYDLLKCSVCLELVGTTPSPSSLSAITLPCGHSFCRECINMSLAAIPLSRPCICPDCRTPVNPGVLTGRQVSVNVRPSVALAEVVRRIIPPVSNSSSSSSASSSAHPRRTRRNRHTRRRTQRR
jgi:hypothetical protein